MDSFSCCSSLAPCSSIRAARSSPAIPTPRAKLALLPPAPRRRLRAAASLVSFAGALNGSLKPPFKSPLLSGRLRRGFDASEAAGAAASTTRARRLLPSRPAAARPPRRPPPPSASSAACTAVSVASSAAVWPSPFFAAAFAPWLSRMATHSAAAFASPSSSGSTAWCSGVLPVLSALFASGFFAGVSKSSLSSTALADMAARCRQVTPS